MNSVLLRNRRRTEGGPREQCTANAPPLATITFGLGAPLRRSRCRDARADLGSRCESAAHRDDVAEIVGCSRAHVYRVVKKFGSASRQELLDGRRDSGRRIADERIDATVKEIVAQSPQDFGYPRPTWTRELLIKVVENKTAILLSLTTMTRVLHRIGARRGRPKPTVKCPL